MSFSNQTIKEGAEPENFFWVALGKREEYDKVMNSKWEKHEFVVKSKKFSLKSYMLET